MGRRRRLPGDDWSATLRIGVPRETSARETRVAATPATVDQAGRPRLRRRRRDRRRARPAASPTRPTPRPGAAVGTADEAWQADVVLRVNAPAVEEIGRLRDGATLISLLSPALNPDLVDALAPRPITVLAMDAVPRISRAQSLDVLSSMANIAGYRAVIEAAHTLRPVLHRPGHRGRQGAAGQGARRRRRRRRAGRDRRGQQPRRDRAGHRRPPGGRRAGALAGRRVRGRARPASRRSAPTATRGRWARTSTAAPRMMYAEQVPDVDIVITTALIPGRPAPRLITEEMVASMKSGSVIVDMAAAQGGNVAGSVADEIVVTANGVSIIGYTDLPGRLPAQASQLYGTNLVNLMKLLTPEQGRPAGPRLRRRRAAGDDRRARRGEDLAATAGAGVRRARSRSAAAAVEPVAAEGATTAVAGSSRWSGSGAAVLFGITAFSPNELIQHFTVFALAVVVGYYVIGHVHHALHTPLMSVTNAISGIIVVGALLQIGHDDPVVTALAFVAILLASINVFGGFAVTRRMLGMFTRG